MKTSELTGVALDWTVATCVGEVTEIRYDGIAWRFKLDGKTKVLAKGWAASMTWNPSTNWALGGPIIQREDISIIRADDEHVIGSDGFCVPGQRTPLWVAAKGQNSTQCSYESEHYPDQYEICEADVIYGPTPLIAAMRVYVLSQLGAEVEVPKGLACLQRLSEGTPS